MSNILVFVKNNEQNIMLQLSKAVKNLMHEYNSKLANQKRMDY